MLTSLNEKMNDDAVWVETARLPIAKMQDVLLARFVGRDEAAKMGFPPVLLTRIATAISEITRNVVQHAGCPGVFQIGQVSVEDRLGLRIIVSDKGKGMENSERFVDHGKLGSSGAGLPGASKVMDTLQVQSAPGEGTAVTMEVWTPKVTT